MWSGEKTSFFLRIIPFPIPNFMHVLIIRMIVSEKFLIYPTNPFGFDMLTDLVRSHVFYKLSNFIQMRISAEWNAKRGNVSILLTIRFAV